MPKRIPPLTDIQITRTKPKDKDYKLADGAGLYLLITKSGGKLWRLKYRFSGKEKLLALGSYPEVGLSEARRRKEDARRLLANNIDPSEIKKAIGAEEKERLANTFKILAIEWQKNIANNSLSKTTQKMVEARLKNDIYPAIGHTPLTDLTPKILLEKVLRPIEERGVIESAHRVRGLISQILRYGVASGKCDRDLTTDLRGALKPIPRRHHAAFDQDGITDTKKVGALLRAIDDFEGYFIVKCALRFHPLVATRPGELRHAEWAEIDLEKATWSIPAKRMKMKKPHIVPLSPQAVSILKELHEITGSGILLFPSIRSTARPISDNSMNAALRRLGFTKDEIVSHGWRAIFRTLADEVLHERVDIIEAQLAHQVSDALGRAYNRTAFLKERRNLMIRWGNYLESLKNGSS